MSSRASTLSELRDRIRLMEQPAGRAVLPFGIAAIDAALPGGGLALGAMHEILGVGGDEEDGAAPCGFIAGILARLDTPTPPSPASKFVSPACGGGSGRGRSRGELWWGQGRRGPVLWCLKRPDLYGPGLLAHGLDPARLVLAAAPRDEDILWALEEGLRAPGLAAVVGEVGRLPMVAGRRLQLAAEHSGTMLLLLRRWRSAAEAAAERARPSAALTRWRIAALPSVPPSPLPLPQLRWGRGGFVGKPRWRVELLRVRGGRTGAWEVEVADATGHVSLSAGLADRPAAPDEGDTGAAWRRRAV